MRGIFPVLQTPLDTDGELDVASLRREVRFCIEAGAHGLVFPALGSEMQYLSDRERQQLVEVVVGEAGGQLPLVVAVSAPSAAIAAEHARHAALVKAQAVMALPPYITPGTPNEILDYYRAIGRAAELPIFVQNVAPGLSPDFLIRLLREIEQIRYIKEEASPSAHNLSAVVRATGDRCNGIFGGAFGRWMLSELRRGAGGFMPAAEITDVYVQVWEAFEAGDHANARRIFNQILPLINLLMLLGLRVSKEVLVRRGIFRSTLMRATGALALDEDDQHELDAILDDLRPFFRCGRGRRSTEAHEGPEVENIVDSATSCDMRIKMRITDVQTIPLKLKGAPRPKGVGSVLVTPSSIVLRAAAQSRGGRPGDRVYAGAGDHRRRLNRRGQRGRGERACALHDRESPEICGAEPESVRCRGAVGAHVPRKHQLRPQRHGDRGDQRDRYCAVGYYGQGDRAAGL